VEQRLNLEKIEIILTDCIKEIRSGKSTLNECLERYPSLRPELETLIRIALNIRELPAFQLEAGYKQSAKTQLLQRISSTKQNKSRSWSDIFSFGLPSQPVWARVVAAVVIGVILLSMLGGSTAYASQNSLPGEILYPVKIGTEEVRIWMLGKNTDKADLNLEFARTRLEELSKLAAGDSNKTVLVLQGYKNNLQAANNNIQNISDAGDLAEVLPGFSEKMGWQISFCDSIYDSNSSDNPSLQEASLLAVNEQISLLTNLAQQNNVLAARANLNMMRNRLQRAQTKANEQQYQAMLEAILQYQYYSELGQQILQNARNTQNQVAIIDDLSSSVLQSCLETLNALSQQVPQGYLNGIENSRDITLQFHNQTSRGNAPNGQSNGGANQESDGSNSQNNTGPDIQQTPMPASPSQGGTESPGNNSSVNTPAPTPGTGGSGDNTVGSGAGNTEPGTGSTNKPDTAPSSTPDTGGNSGSGNGTGSGSDTGSGGSTNPPSGSTTISGGGGKR
jgi:hypothetical protein